MSTKVSRQSNFELLRILCMMGVIVGHALLFLYQDEIHSQNWSILNQGRVLLLNANSTAINCFILISGYFTIHLCWKRILLFFGTCFWYVVIIGLFSGGTWQSMLFPVTESGMWFLPCYFALMLLSPLINAGLNALSSNELKKAVGLLLVADIYLGYMHQCEEIGESGYGILHFVSMYCLGRLIYSQDYKLPNAGIWCLICFLGMTLLHAIKMMWSPISILYSLHYNSPMLVMASVIVFLWAKGLTIKSRWVDWIASSVFAVYLIQCNHAVIPYFNENLEAASGYSSPFTAFGLICCFLFFVFMGAILLDKIRVYVFGAIIRLWNRHC